MSLEEQYHAEQMRAQREIEELYKKMAEDEQRLAELEAEQREFNKVFATPNILAAMSMVDVQNMDARFAANEDKINEMTGMYGQKGFKENYTDQISRLENRRDEAGIKGKLCTFFHEQYPTATDDQVRNASENALANFKEYGFGTTYMSHTPVKNMIEQVGRYEQCDLSPQDVTEYGRDWADEMSQAKLNIRAYIREMNPNISEQDVNKRADKLMEKLENKGVSYKEMSTRDGLKEKLVKMEKEDQKLKAQKAAEDLDDPFETRMNRGMF